MEDEQSWQRLLDEQTALFRRTIKRNSDLEARVVELERELSVWKVAFTSNDEEKALLKKQVVRLERSIGALKDDNPLVLCLIDGDGNLFSQDLVAQGLPGGRQAAQLLTKGIVDYLAETEDSREDVLSSISGRAQIWASVYCNKSGLQETFTSRQLCTLDQFEAFMMGFNQASPLFSIVDVGNGKEAADTKIKECLRVFTRFPQACKIFFGGGHDNGYASILNSLNNEGFLDKIILLRGYRELAFEIEALKLPIIEFEGLFMIQKLPFNHHHYKKTTNSTLVEFDKRSSSRNTSNSTQSSPSKFNLKSRRYSNSPSNLLKLIPSPCNFYYLAVCKAGTACRYAHDYDLDPEQIAAMRVNAKKSPCGQANRNQPCPFGDRCPLGHRCPSGLRCKFFKTGKCKFAASGMHDEGDDTLSPPPSIMPPPTSSFVTPSEPVTPGATPPATPPRLGIGMGQWYSQFGAKIREEQSTLGSTISQMRS